MNHAPPAAAAGRGGVVVLPPQAVPDLGGLTQAPLTFCCPPRAVQTPPVEMSQTFFEIALKSGLSLADGVSESCSPGTNPPIPVADDQPPCRRCSGTPTAVERKPRCLGAGASSVSRGGPGGRSLLHFKSTAVGDPRRQRLLLCPGGPGGQRGKPNRSGEVSRRRTGGHQPAGSGQRQCASSSGIRQVGAASGREMEHRGDTRDPSMASLSCRYDPNVPFRGGWPLPTLAPHC